MLENLIDLRNGFVSIDQSVDVQIGHGVCLRHSFIHDEETSLGMCLESLESSGGIVAVFTTTGGLSCLG